MASADADSNVEDEETFVDVDEDQLREALRQSRHEVWKLREQHKTLTALYEGLGDEHERALAKTNAEHQAALAKKDAEYRRDLDRSNAVASSAITQRNDAEGKLKAAAAKVLQLQQYEKAVSDAQTKVDIAQRDIADKNETIVTLRAQITTQAEKIEQQAAEHGRIVDEMNKLAAENLNLTNGGVPATRQGDAQPAADEHTEQLSRAQARVQELERRLEEAQSSAAAERVDREAQISHVQTENAALSREKARLEREIENATASADLVTARYEPLNTAYQAALTQTAELRQANHDLESERAQLRREVAELKSATGLTGQTTTTQAPPASRRPGGHPPHQGLRTPQVSAQFGDDWAWDIPKGFPAFQSVQPQRAQSVPLVPVDEGDHSHPTTVVVLPPDLRDSRDKDDLTKWGKRNDAYFEGTPEHAYYAKIEAELNNVLQYSRPILLRACLRRTQAQSNEEMDAEESDFPSGEEDEENDAGGMRKRSRVMEVDFVPRDATLDWIEGLYVVDPPVLRIERGLEYAMRGTVVPPDHEELVEDKKIKYIAREFRLGCTLNAPSTAVQGTKGPDTRAERDTLFFYLTEILRPRKQIDLSAYGREMVARARAART